MFWNAPRLYQWVNPPPCCHTPDWQGGSARFLVTTKRRCIAHQGRSARSHSSNTRPRGRANCPLDNRTRHRRKGCQSGTCPQGYPRSDRCRGSFRPRPSTHRIGKATQSCDCRADALPIRRVARSQRRPPLHVYIFDPELLHGWHRSAHLLRTS